MASTKKKTTVKLSEESREEVIALLVSVFPRDVVVPAYAPSQPEEDEGAISITEEQRTRFANDAALCSASLDRLDALELCFRSSFALRRKTLQNQQHKLLTALHSGVILDPESPRARQDHWREEQKAEAAEAAEEAAAGAEEGSSEG